MTELSIEHILLFLIVVFLFYHFLGNCGCVKEINGFSVGVQSASPTCKCKYTDCFYPNKSTNLPEARCSNAKNASECTCDYEIGRTPYKSECNSGISWMREDACIWNKCNSITYGDDGNTYTFDLTPLKLDPRNGSIIYEITSPLGSGWTTTTGKKITSDQLSVLNCLQEQTKIRYIGVKKAEWWMDGKYQIRIGINPGENGADINAIDETDDSYGLNITNTSILQHFTAYGSDKPKITKLIVVQ